MLHRPHLKLITNRLTESKNRIQVVIGPRQVGKTTLMLQLKERWKHPVRYVSADTAPGATGVWISQQWEQARIINIRSGREVLLIIDEIQKIPDWSAYVKKEWDQDRINPVPVRVVILGSSSMLIQKGLSESMAGRYESMYMGHWTYAEMHEEFGFSPEEYVWFGGYPGAADLVKSESRWSQYIRESFIESSINRDILMMSTIHKPALLRQLFELGSRYSGQILSLTKILGQLHDAGNTTTLTHYLHLLDTAGLLSGLQKFSTKAVRSRSSIPKFQIQNMALMSALQPENREQIMLDTEKWGRWVESAVGTHLLKYAKESDAELFYWRESNREIDFVLKKGTQIVGIEVKSGLSSAVKGAEYFQKQFKPDNILLVGTGGIPWQEFLQIQPDTLFH